MNILEEVVSKKEDYLVNIKEQIEKNKGFDDEDKIIQVDKFTRPQILFVGPTTLAIGSEMYELGKQAKILIDDNILRIFDENEKDNYPRLGAREYIAYKTCEAGINDIQVISMLKIHQLTTPWHALGTALYLIAMDLRKEGLLYKISQIGQENIDTGFCDLNDDTHTSLPHVMYVEKPKRRVGEYHVHSDVIPRRYKIDRHKLVDNG